MTALSPDREPPSATERGLASPVPARGTFGLLLDPLFGPYFVGKLLSTTGVWVFSMVAAVVMWDLTGSALAVGGVSIAQFVPQLLFAPLSGAQADKGDPKLQLIAGRLLVMLGGLILTVATWDGGVAGLDGPWIVLVAAATVGVGFVVGLPAQHSLLPSLVRPSETSRVVALNALAPIVARSGGPMLGTFLLVTAGPHWAFSVTVATNLVFAFIIVGLPIRGLVQRAPAGTHTVRRGLAHIRRDRPLVLLLVTVLAVGLGADPMITLTPALSAHLGYGEALVGALATAFGVGAAMAYFAIAPLRRHRGDGQLTAFGLAALSLGLLLAGLAPAAAVAVTAMGVSGVGFCWALTGATTRIYDRVPQSLRGRVMAVWSMGFAGSRPISAAFSGALADLTSVAIGFAGVAAVVGALGVWAHVGGGEAHPPPVIP